MPTHQPFVFLQVCILTDEIQILNFFFFFKTFYNIRFFLLQSWLIAFFLLVPSEHKAERVGYHFNPSDR